VELAEIQRGVLSPRPSPYAATYLVFRIDDRAAGRKLMRRAADVVTTAADPASPLGETTVSFAVTCHGLKALGVAPPSIDSMAWEFRQGMAARATALGDTGPGRPERWEPPLGSPEVHVILVVLAPDTALLDAASTWPGPGTSGWPGAPRSGGRTATPCRPRPSRSAIATASATPPSRAAGFPVRTRSSRP